VITVENVSGGSVFSRQTVVRKRLCQMNWNVQPL